MALPRPKIRSLESGLQVACRSNRCWLVPGSRPFTRKTLPHVERPSTPWLSQLAWVLIARPSARPQHGNSLKMFKSPTGQGRSNHHWAGAWNPKRPPSIPLRYFIDQGAIRYTQVSQMSQAWLTSWGDGGHQIVAYPARGCRIRCSHVSLRTRDRDG